jgi:translation initiation factor 2B subunit (eIF-2B alpha/beta/delta family)
MVFNLYRFKRICRRIRDIKIQGATNIAKAAIKAYYLYPSPIAKRILMNLRPTEPMLTHVMALVDKKSKKEILAHFSDAQEKINKYAIKLIKDNFVIFTHCHSTNVVNALKYAKKHGKHFQVYNTETRPLFQGRKTALELAEAGIKVTQFADSAIKIALTKDQDREEFTRPVNMVLLGADALLDSSVVNKVGSGMIAEIAHDNKIPVYIIADSWKYSHKSVPLEQRDFREIWGTKEIHIKNPAFEAIALKNIKGIVTEYGLMSYKKFLSRMKKR